MEVDNVLGRKIYYEIGTGDVILITGEKQGLTAINTTKEQDFQMYSVLQARTAESIDVIQLAYGEYGADFQTASSIKVDLATSELMFEFPYYEPPLGVAVEQLRQQNSANNMENEKLKLENSKIKQTQIEQDEILMQLLLGGI